MQFDDEHFAIEVGPHLHSSLDAETPLFRIVDFYSFAKVVAESRLYIPLAVQFSDQNEGVDAALTRHAITSGPCAGAVGPHFKSKQEFLEYQTWKRSRSYISCWTRERESVAMWALYSQDHCSIQMETTVGRLVSAANRLAKENYNPLDAALDNNQHGLAVMRVELMPVAYISLIELGRRIDRRRRAFEYLEARGVISEMTSLNATSRRDLQRSGDYHFSSFSLKDASFSHEREVRLIVTATPVTGDMKLEARDFMVKFERESAVSDEAYYNAQIAYARALAQEESIAQGLQAPALLDLQVDSGFITKATIDPRCLSHKRDFMERFLESQKVTQGHSHCFGHVAKSFPVVPRSKLTPTDNEPH